MDMAIRDTSLTAVRMAKDQIKRKNRGGSMIVRFMCALLAFNLVASAHAQAVKPQATSSSTSSFLPAPPSLPISYGDLIDVQVFDSPELSGAFRVDQAGEVVLKLGGAVQVKGLTAAE